MLVLEPTGVSFPPSRNLVPPVLEPQIWCADLHEAARHGGFLKASLSAEEIARASRFHRPQDREEYELSRGLLRHLLGTYLGLEAAHLEFEYGFRGKPRVAGIEFSISHAAGLFTGVFAAGVEVGIDHERVREVEGWDQIAQSYFSEREQRQLAAVEGAERERWFLRYWVRREAYAKAGGGGLAWNLDSQERELDPAQFDRALEAALGSGHQWTLYEFVPAADFAGAVAIHKAAAGPPRAFCPRW